MTRWSTGRRRGVVGVLVTASLGLGLVLAPAAGGDELDDLYSLEEQLRAEQEAIAAALEQLGTDLEHTDAALVEAYTALKGIEARIGVAEAELQVAVDRHAQLAREAAIVADRLSAAEVEEKGITTRIAEDTERATDLRSAIGQMARDAYKGDLATSSLTAVLDATSTEDFVVQAALADTALRTQTQSLRELDEITGVNRNREARLAAVRVEIADLKDEADAKVAAAEVARQEAEARRADLEILRRDQVEKTRVIEAQKQRQLELQQEYEAQSRQLEADLQETIRLRDEEIERRRDAGEDPGIGTGKLGNPTRLNPYYVTSHYGWRLHPILGYERLHAGTDFRAYCGDPIIASDSGTVVWSMMRAGYGNQVMIDHGRHDGVSIMTSYNHLSSYTVGRGDVVSKGDLVGYSGNTGTSVACHLHFEVYLDGKTVDPLSMM